MGKRAFASLLAIAICVAPFPQANAATAKAGANCTKLKATSIAKGKKFTCVKSGKKLVWNKGVIVKAAVTKPKPTPTPAPADSIPECPKLDSADQSGISQKRAEALIEINEAKG